MESEKYPEPSASHDNVLDIPLFRGSDGNEWVSHCEKAIFTCGLLSLPRKHMENVKMVNEIRKWNFAKIMAAGQGSKKSSLY